MNHPRLKTLYVDRPLLNKEEIEKWAKSQGFESVLEDLHVTIAFSKKPIDWFHEESLMRNLIIKNGERTIEQFGSAVVLCFGSNKLYERWVQFRNIGASWDFPDYRSHVTLTYEPMPPDVAPYEGRLVFGPETFSEINENWSDDVKEKTL